MPLSSDFRCCFPGEFTADYLARILTILVFLSRRGTQHVSGHRIQFAIPDHHHTFVGGYYYRLEKHPEFETIGVTAFGDHLAELLRRESTDVVMRDISGPPSSLQRLAVCADDNRPRDR